MKENFNSNSILPNNYDISVIIPIHNGAETLERCLKTLLVESEISQEIIIINDFSTDNSNEIITNYIQKYSNIKLINTDHNIGAGLSRNIGIREASGEYIGFVDCDDWVDCGLFAIVIKKLKQTNADIAVFGVRDEYGNSFNSKIRYNYTNQLTFSTDTAMELLSRNITNKEYISPMVCQKVYRRQFLIENNLFFSENRHFEDDIFSYICFMKKGTVTIVPSVEYHYMQYHFSVSHTISKEYVENFVKAFKYLRKELEQEEIFEKMQHSFFSYMDKSLSSFFKVLITEEQNVIKQKEHLAVLFSSLHDVISVREAIEYIDLLRFQKFWD